MISERRVYQRTDAVALHFSEWNPGGEPILLLHGLADHSLVWSRLGDALSHHYHVVAPDLRGHGDSSKPDQGYTSADIVEDLKALINSLGWTKAHILGHSWAGKLVCFWATHYPDMFASLILVDPFFVKTLPQWTRLTFPLLYRFLPFLKTMGPFDSYAAAEAVGRSLKQYRAWTPFQQLVFQFSVEEKAGGQWGSKFALAARNQIFEDVVNTSGLVSAIDIPTLLIKPDQGLNRFQWQLQPYFSYLNTLNLATVPGNHWAFLTDPEAFNLVVQQFLATHSL